MQILTSGPHCRGENGTFIVGARPANAISGEIKWERWGEREISIFYEPFPLLPLGSLWLSASNRIPSSLIPFSKNVIRKSPFGLSAATLSSCAGSAARSYIITSLGSSLSLTLLSQTLHTVSSGRGKTHIPRPFLLHMIASAPGKLWFLRSSSSQTCSFSSSSAPCIVIKSKPVQRKTSVNPWLIQTFFGGNFQHVLAVGPQKLGLCHNPLFFAQTLFLRLHEMPSDMTKQPYLTPWE